VQLIAPPSTHDCFFVRIIIGSDRRPETRQGIEGKIARFRTGRVIDRVRVSDK